MMENLIKRLKNQLSTHFLSKNSYLDDIIPKDGEFCLNFKFIAPDSSKGNSLKNKLTERVDCDVFIEITGLVFKKYIVLGTTKPVKSNDGALKKLIDQIIFIGECEKCKFAGWWLWNYDNLLILKEL